MLEEAIEEEKERLRSYGESTRKAERKAKETILEWMNQEENEILTTADGIKYEAFAHLRTSYLLTIALRHLLDRAN